MTDPFDPDGPLEPYDPLEHSLRRSLAERAQDAPDATALTERLLAAGVDTPRRGWNTWVLPLVAAACVALIVGIVLVVVRPGHSDSGPDAVQRPSRPVPVTSPVTVATSPQSTVPPTSPSTASTGSSSVLQNVRVADLTFTGLDVGWALATADCPNSSARCPALLHTTDGTTWTGQRNVHFTVSGAGSCPAASCVEHLRFATDRIGYAYGPDALYLTTDGAQSWVKQDGGAVALETLNDDVIRVSTRANAVTVATAGLGSTQWTTRVLPDLPAKPSGFALARTSSAAYVVSQANATGDSASVLWASTNDGQSWSRRGPACPTGSNIISSNGVAVAPDGAVALACWTDTGATTVVVGTRAGLSLHGGAPVPRSGDAPPFVAAASQAIVLAGMKGLFRSADAGSSWTARPAVDVSAGVTFAGFESATVGRLITGDGQTIWTTRDAGASWTRISF